MTAIDPASSAPTRSRMKKLRRRSVIRASGSLLLRGQDEEQTPVVVVGGKEVGGRLRGQIALRIHLDRLAQLAHAPLQDGGDVVLAVGELQAQDVVGGPPNDLLLLEAGELERSLAGA